MKQRGVKMSDWENPNLKDIIIPRVDFTDEEVITLKEMVIVYKNKNE